MSRIVMNKVIKGHFLFTYSIIVMLTAIYFSVDTYADESNDDQNRFTSSEFNPSSFKDTSFEKSDYKDLSSIRSAVSKLLREDSDSMLREAESSRKGKADSTLSPAKDNSQKGPLKNNNENKMESDRTAPVTELPGDWIPDKLDLTSNGGFEVAPDNGSPVPYRLNGHVDIQRGRP